MKLLTTSEAARVANLSAETIRAYEKTGRLVAATKLGNGTRLFSETDIERLANERKKDKSR